MTPPPLLETQNHDQLVGIAQRLLAEAQALSSRISAVNEIATAINQTLDLDQILRVVGKQAKWLLDYDHLSVYLKVGTAHRLVTLYDRKHGTSREENPIWAEDTSIAHAMRSKQAQMTHQGARGDFLTDYPAQIVIPLQNEGEALGTLNFASATPNAYTQEDIRISYLLALQLAAALRNAARFDELNRVNAELEQEKRRSDALLLNILPNSIANELKQRGTVKPTFHPNVTVMFTDFTNFTSVAAHMEPHALIAELDICFSYFDHVIGRLGLEKLKTIGDSYMCVGGIPIASPTHAHDVVRAAMQIQAFAQNRQAEKREQGKPYWGLRVGIHSGSLIAGVIGNMKYAYDVWGDTVNTAARVEQAGEAGRINISIATYELVREQFECMPQRSVTVKDGRVMEMCFVIKEREAVLIGSAL